MAPAHPYTPHDALARNAATRPEPWRLPIGMMVMLVAGFGLGSFYWTILQGLTLPLGYDLQAEAESGQSAAGMLALLFSFATMAGGLALALALVHGRRLLDLLGPLDLCWRQFRRVALYLVVLQLVIAILPPWSQDTELVRNLDTNAWLALLPFAVIAIGVQIATEEMIFRGYLQQHLAARFARPAVWISVPAILFGLGHYTPGTLGDNAMPVAIWAALFSLAASDLTARAGTLGPALALHMVNNGFAILILSYQGNLSGLSLYTLPHDMSEAESIRAALPVDLLSLLVSWLCARIALRR